MRSNFLTKEYFNVHKSDMKMGYYLITGFPVGIISLFFTLSMTAGPLWLNPAIFVPLGLLMWLLPTFGITNLGRLHAAYNVPNDTYSHHLKSEAIKYLAMPSADRALYPPNLLNTLKDPDLNYDDKNKLSNAMQDIREDIEKRNNIRAQLSKRNVDISGLIEAMDDSKRSVGIEIEIFQEYLK